MSHISPSQNPGSNGTGDDGTNSAKMRYALRTFGGSSPRRRHFDTIDELEHGYEVGASDDNKNMDLYGGDAHAQWTAVVHRGPDVVAEREGVAACGQARGCAGKPKKEDAIVQTLSTSVTYGFTNTVRTT